MIDAFLDKNRDVLSDDLRELLETSAAPLTRALADRGFMTEQVLVGEVKEILWIYFRFFVQVQILLCFE